MPETPVTRAAARSDASTASPLLKRRGLIAAAWAAVVGLVLKATTQPAEAVTGLNYQNTANGTFVENGAGGPTGISGLTYSSTSPIFSAFTHASSALAGLSGAVSSVRWTPPMRAGVWGYQERTGEPSAGVLGEDSTATGVGVWGRSGLNGVLADGIGVKGQSGGGVAVLGEIPAASDENATAVYGANYSTYAGPGPGAGGFGVYGLSARGHGLVGATAAAGAAAVVGATNGVSGAYAAAFYGPVIVGGDFTVVGGAKSAAVAHPDGSHRRLYCVESPESWFEDFGEGQLVNGRADITLDPDFAAVVNTDNYHVFLTAHADHDGLHVSGRRAGGFSVQARGGSGCASFSWRIVARRKDISGTRLEPVAVPPAPVLPAAPVSSPDGSSVVPRGIPLSSKAP